MDTGLQHEKLCQMLKTQQEKHLSPRQAVPANQWRTMESDAENFVPEYIVPEKENADSLQHWDGEDDDANDDNIEDLQIYDSLEVLAHSQIKKNPNPLQTSVGTEKDGSR